MTRRSPATPGDQIYQRLRFPKRAEFLGQFSTYRVHLSHWSPLAAPFQDAFEGVHTRGDAAVLLIHGAQGSGKTLFCRRLEEDFDRTKKGAHAPDKENLWHTLVGAQPPQQDIIRHATAHTVMRRVKPDPGWLEKERKFAEEDRDYRVRVFILDDAHRDGFVCEWAGVSQEWYQGQVERKSQWVTLASVAQRMVEGCRGSFQRSIFVLVSNQREMMERLKSELDRWEQGLATIQELPLPTSIDKETIIRTNTNRLNRVSYWYCLDVAGPTEKERVHEVLHDQSGYTDSFVAVDGALKAERRGRPAHRNVLTLVTLGTEPALMQSFLSDHDLPAEKEFLGAHMAVFLATKEWATQLLGEEDDAETTRRAELVQSEFAFRLVTLDARSTFALCQPPVPGDLGERLLKAIRFFPSIGSSSGKDGQLAFYGATDAELSRMNESAVEAFEEQFKRLGRDRSQLYESALRARLQPYGQGFQQFPDVRPDYIAAEYQPCAVASVKERQAEKITKAIRRTAHAIEFTSFLRSEMAGLDRYLVGKVKRYALLLESV